MSMPGLPAQYDEFSVKRWLQEAGIPTTGEQLAHNADEAARAAEMLGFPIVMKINSPDIQHKTEAGGVVLNLSDAQAVRDSYRTMLEVVGQRQPDARIDGVLICQQVRGGVETLIGVQRDPIFGPVVVFGLGGIFVETLKDVAMRAAPFDLATAREMMGEIRGYPLLTGTRDRPAADLTCLAETLVIVSRLAWQHRDRLESLDINPFIVLAEGQGAVAVDGLIVPRQAD